VLLVVQPGIWAYIGKDLNPTDINVVANQTEDPHTHKQDE
jgi:hypothetical protein